MGKIANNYEWISFNFGPTLLSWLKGRVAGHAIERSYGATKAGRERFGGHGTAIAQAYSHMIMPLANSRDKRTQVIWGIRDFESHFGRQPEGMWLPETAVDLESARYPGAARNPVHYPEPRTGCAGSQDQYP